MLAPHPSDPASDPRRRRLLFRACHRGTHENDLMLGGYVAARLAEFTLAELDQLEALLALPDVALSDWLTGRRPVPAAQACPLLDQICAYVAAGGAVQHP